MDECSHYNWRWLVTRHKTLEKAQLSLMSNWNDSGHRNDGPWWVAPSQSGLGRSISLRTAILIALVVGVVGGAFGASSTGSLFGRSVNLVKTTSAIERPAGSVAEIAQRVLPSVVSIEAQSGRGGSTGSGFIIDSSGYILTNNHVIASSAVSGGDIRVRLNDGFSYDAKVVGRDSSYDLAVIKIVAPNLKALQFGDSDEVAVGDSVIAIGSPLGLASTVTSGIISALNRPVSTGTADAQSYVNAIQTDAAINPGNSGGALIDSQGRIIGVNSAIATLSSGSASGSIGLGFSIPINEAKRVIDEIIATGKSTRPVLGVYFDPNYSAGGARIARLSANEGAEKAGIPVGSIIRSIDGFKIPDTDTAIVRIRSYVPGTTVTIVVELPTGGNKTFRVTLGSAPSL